jgi:hypothetical protein
MRKVSIEQAWMKGFDAGSRLLSSMGNRQPWQHSVFTGLDGRQRGVRRPKYLVAVDSSLG